MRRKEEEGKGEISIPTKEEKNVNLRNSVLK